MSKNFLTVKQVTDKFGYALGGGTDSTIQNNFCTKSTLSNMGAKTEPLAKYRDTDYPVDDDILQSLVSIENKNITISNSAGLYVLNPQMRLDKAFMLGCDFSPKAGEKYALGRIFTFVDSADRVIMSYIAYLNAGYILTISPPNGGTVDGVTGLTTIVLTNTPTDKNVLTIIYVPPIFNIRFNDNTVKNTSVNFGIESLYGVRLGDSTSVEGGAALEGTINLFALRGEAV